MLIHPLIHAQMYDSDSAYFLEKYNFERGSSIFACFRKGEYIASSPVDRFGDDEICRSSDIVRFLENCNALLDAPTQVHKNLLKSTIFPLSSITSNIFA